MNRLGKILLIGFVTLLCSAANQQTAFANVRLAFDSASLNFGDVPLTGTKSLTIEVWDTVAADIEIDRFSFSGLNAGDFSLTADSTTPFVVLADSGNIIKIVVTFSPTATGSRMAFLDVETSDGTVAISLSGNGGAKSSLALSQISIDFGLLGPGGQTDSVIELYSTGTDSASVSGIEIASADASFTARTLSAVQPPFMLAPGDSVAVDISFTGLLPEGEKDAQLKVFGASLNVPECDLKGTVEYGAFDVMPSFVNFGTMYVGEVHDSMILLENTSEVPIAVEDVGLDPSGDDFTLLTTIDTPLMIPAGGNLPLTIRANPGFATSHSAQLYVVSQSADPNFESANLIMAVVAPSISFPAVQSLSYFCANGAASSLTVPLSNTGSGSLVISNLVTSDSQVALTIDHPFPDTVAPGEVQSLALQFDLSKVSGDTLLIEGIGGVHVMVADTVLLVPSVSNATSSVISLSTQSATQGELSVGTATDLTPFDIDTFIVHIDVNDPNVASISLPDIKLAASAGSAKIESIVPELGGFSVTISSSSPIPLTAGSSILNIGFNRFVSEADSSDVLVSFETPEKAGCLVWNSDSTIVQGASVCGSTIMRDAMVGAPMILSAALRENPVLGPNAGIVIFASNAVSQARYSFVNAVGESVSNGALDLVSGQNYREFSLSGFPSGVYLLRISTSDGFTTELRLIKLD